MKIRVYFSYMHQTQKNIIAFYFVFYLMKYNRKHLRNTKNPGYLLNIKKKCMKSEQFLKKYIGENLKLVEE